MQKENRRVFFLDRDGREYYNEDYDNHEELAIWIIENDEDLKERFEKSRMKLEIAFLLKEGWIYGTDSERYKEVVCLAQEVSEKGRELIGYYREEGYKPYDLKKVYSEESLNEFLGKIEEQKEQKQQEQQER